MVTCQYTGWSVRCDGELGNLKLDGNGKKGSDRVEILLLGRHVITNILQHQQLFCWKFSRAFGTHQDMSFAVIRSLVLIRLQNCSINWGKVVALITANVTTGEGIQMGSKSSAKLSTNWWFWRIFFHKKGSVLFGIIMLVDRAYFCCLLTKLLEFSFSFTIKSYGTWGIHFFEWHGAGLKTVEWLARKNKQAKINKIEITGILTHVSNSLYRTRILADRILVPNLTITSRIQS